VSYLGRSGGEFNSRKVSPSRVNALAQCGIAFEMKYLLGLPEEVNGSASLFGSVVHAALEKWAPNRKADLLTLMRTGWLDVTKGTSVADFLGEYANLSVEAIKVEHAIRAARPDIVAPRRTKDWKDSDVAKRTARLLAVWIPRLEAESPWRFTGNDPLPGLYDESLVLAKRYEERWRHLPAPYYTEFGFDIEWRGFRLNGHIDTIEPLIDRDTGELMGLGVKDYKTYRNEPPAQKDWRQLTMYDVAVRDLIERGQLPLPIDPDSVPLLAGIDYVRWSDSWADTRPIEWREHDEHDHERLLRELERYLTTVEGRAFLPASKDSKPDFCNYPSMCCLTTTAQAGGGAKRVEVNL
jgi:hypothetical protein